MKPKIEYVLTINTPVQVVQINHGSDIVQFCFSSGYSNYWLGPHVARWTLKSSRETRPKISEK